MDSSFWFALVGLMASAINAWRAYSKGNGDALWGWAVAGMLFAGDM